MTYYMTPRGGNYFEHMEKDVLFNRWWQRMTEGAQLETTKRIAYGAWQAGIRHFIEAQTPIAYWESSGKKPDHVTFDKDLADRWKLHYNMAVEH